MIKNFSVPNPCNESWDGMKPDGNGRYCNACQKTVIDFTTKTEQEIIEYLQANVGKKMCGTFKTAQLLQQQKKVEQQKNESVLRFIAAILLVFGSSLISCKYEKGRLHSVDLGDTINEVYSECYVTTGVIFVPTSTDTLSLLKNGVGVQIVDEIDSAEQQYTVGDIAPIEQE
jgi:hypothetical protein